MRKFNIIAIAAALTASILSGCGAATEKFEPDYIIASIKDSDVKLDYATANTYVRIMQAEEDEMLKLLPVAYQDMMTYGELDDDEKELLELWKKILGEAKQTEKYNPELNYGVYQITKELNTFIEEKKGKGKKKVYDYPQLNGDLNTLRTKLKEYYVSHIKEKMFKYQLIK